MRFTYGILVIINFVHILYCVHSINTAIDSLVRVTSTGSGQPGSRYVLICTIILPTGVTVSDVPSVEWRRPSGGSTTGNVFSGGVSGSGSVYISQLILDPLTLSDHFSTGNIFPCLNISRQTTDSSGYVACVVHVP